MNISSDEETFRKLNFNPFSTKAPLLKDINFDA